MRIICGVAGLKLDQEDGPHANDSRRRLWLRLAGCVSPPVSDWGEPGRADLFNHSKVGLSAKLMTRTSSNDSSGASGLSPEFSLLAEAAGGSDNAMGQLLAEIQAPLLARIRLMMGDGARRVAESGDFLGGLMLDLVEGMRADQIPPDVDLIRWATSIARNNIRDSVRKRHEVRIAEFSSAICAVRDPVDGAQLPERGPEQAEQVERMLDAMEKLSPDHRRVIELKDFDQLPYREIARKFGHESENAVQLLHARALAKLSSLCV